jgi:hypothetical protein
MLEEELGDKKDDEQDKTTGGATRKSDDLGWA